MNTFDFSPLYRSTIGFDRLARHLDNAIHRNNAQPGYPPYNIELLTDTQYQITMAVAGFDITDITIEQEKNTLTVHGEKADKATKNYLHQGIAARNFSQTFQLADHVNVLKADMHNGLLHIDLRKEVPEAMQARTIEITDTQALAA